MPKPIAPYKHATDIMCPVFRLGLDKQRTEPIIQQQQPLSNNDIQLEYSSFLLFLVLFPIRTGAWSRGPSATHAFCVRRLPAGRVRSGSFSRRRRCRRRRSARRTRWPFPLGSVGAHSSYLPWTPRVRTLSVARLAGHIGQLPTTKQKLSFYCHKRDLPWPWLNEVSVPFVGTNFTL